MEDSKPMTTLQQQRDELVDRLRAELRRMVRESGLTQRAVEEANGFTRGYLSQVLQGHVTLSTRHVFGISLALGLTPEELVPRLFEDRRLGRREHLSEIRERMAVYDAALEQLERKGLLSSEPDSES